jgi:hypothetical protein
MRGMMINSIDGDQWLNVISESRDRIYLAFFFFNFPLGRNQTRDPRIPEPKRTPLGYILPMYTTDVASNFGAPSIKNVFFIIPES